MTTKYQKQQKKYKEEQKKAENSSTRLDLKSITYIVLFLCSIAILCFVITTDIKGYLIQQNPNWTKTTGQVQSIEKITGIKQTKIGNQVETTGYKIKYYYVVNNVVYEQVYLSGTGQKNLHRFINFVKPLDSIEVYYKKKCPKSSYINFNTNSDFYRNEKNKYNAIYY